MVLNRLLKNAIPIARSISTSPIRDGHHSTRGIIGSNLPFQIQNRYRLLVVFILYAGSGLAVPFLILRYLTLQKNQ